MRDHGTTHWAEGLKYVANMKNRRHHQGIGRSPYEALFGCPMKVGLGTSYPADLVANLESGEDLEVRVGISGVVRSGAHNKLILVTSPGVH